MKPVIKVTFMRKNDIFYETEWYYSQTVMGMKSQISSKTNIPIDNQIFVFNGFPLRNEYTREQCGIHDDGCQIQFFLIIDTVAITVVWAEQRIVVHANVLWTIQYVKAQMIPGIARVFPEDPDFRQDRADPDMFDLFLGERLVNENSTVLLLNLNDDDELVVLKRCRVELTINGSMQVWLLLNRMNTIGELKQQLNNNFGIPLNATLHLVGHGDLDNNDMPLILNDIENGSRLISTYPPPVSHDFTHLLL